MTRPRHAARLYLLLTRAALVVAAFAVCGLRPALFAADPPIHSDLPYAVTFPQTDAKFVRVVLHATNGGGQGCIDEFEVYGPDGKRNLALDTNGGKASASSLLGGYSAHTVEHLNDGEYGNAFSWIPATTSDEWAQIELPQVSSVCRVVISRDRNRQFDDRVPTEFDVQVSTNGKDFTTVRQVKTVAISGAIAGAQGGVAPYVPPPPPPPRFGDGGSVTQVAGADLKAPAQDELGLANLAVRPGVKPAASSVFADGALPIHQIAHLNDGLGGNEHSWISKGDPSWAEVDLGDTYSVCHVALGSDSSRKYDDRAITGFAVLVATKYDKNSGAPVWHQAFRQTEGAPVHVRTDFWFKPVSARWVRIAVATSSGGEARIDELEVYGQKAPIAPDKVARLLTVGTPSRDTFEAQLKYAFLGEEHAWLKIFGWADLDPSLVPYNGRVKEYPRHGDDDSLPLPPLASAPTLDAKLDDACWSGASAGCSRVAYPYDFERGPLVEQTVRAGWQGSDLYLGLRMSQLLSSHLAVVSSADWAGCGVIALTADGLVFNTYAREGQDGGKLDKSIPLQGKYDTATGCCEVKLPLDLFPRCRDIGLRVGLGLGGRHTPATGRAVNFSFAPLAVAVDGSAASGVFRVRLTAPAAGDAVTVHAAAKGLDEDIALKPGETKLIPVRGEESGLGPKCDLKLNDGTGRYALHLFRYDPTGRTLAQMTELAQRMAAKGLDVAAERASLSRLQVQHEKLQAPATPDLPRERKLLYDARLAKRELFYRDPDLAPLERLLFVKRQPFMPSHIYTDLTDAPFRPGGAVCRLEVPREGGRLTPGKAVATALFESKAGIARDPAAAFDLSRIYFGYRPAADGFFHIMSMKADGSDLKQLTTGPYHDFYPCPLPDGDLAFIATRCTCRVFCFRPGSYVLHRMKSDGSDLKRLSLASLSEWAPSVMNDGRIIWTRWEYVDKGADFSQTLWSIHPDGTHPEMVFGNDIIQPNGYACGREVPGTDEILCTLVSHFGDINGPLALLDLGKGRSNPQAITSVTPEVPWPGNWPTTECFRDPVPLSRDLFLCAHAPRDRFGLYVVDRFGNRELLYMDDTISSMGATLLRAVAPPPVVAQAATPNADAGTLMLMDVNRGLEPTVQRGAVKWLRVVEEVRHDMSETPNRDYADFMKFYASPVDIVYGPFGWPAYVAKASLGLVPVGADGSASFSAPAGKTVYFEALDANFNELQRMRSVVHLQPGEKRTCVGCHDSRNTAPPVARARAAVGASLEQIQVPSWGSEPFSYERVVQPVLDANCAKCHTAQHARKIDLTGKLDPERVPASYRTLITRGLVHYLDCGWNSAGCEKREPLTFGTLKSKLWAVLDAGHHGVSLTEDEKLRIKTWTDLNCPLWPDYTERGKRPG